MLSPLEPLLEDPGLPMWELPTELEHLYSGSIGFDSPRTIANFVETLDGIVAIPDLPRSNALIADRSEADRFVLALLRACADAIVLGSGTLLASPKGTWRPDHAYPPVAEALAELRRSRGQSEQPVVVIVTSGGSFDPTHPVLEDGALVLTTPAAEDRLRAAVPQATKVLACGGDAGAVDLGAAIALLRKRGHALILSEGGPTVLGSLLASGLVDELFLTVSPLIAGRAAAPRLSLVEGVELLPEHRVEGSLRSIRRSHQHMFLRYALDPQH